MIHMSVKILAFDLDGTLLDDKKHISEENLKALKAAAAAGALLVPATGRIYTGIPQTLRELPGLRYCLTINGAYAYDAGEDKNLYSAEMPAELCLRLIEHMESLPVIYDCYQDNWGFISRHMLEQAAEYIPDPGILKMMWDLRTPVDSLYDTLKEKGRPVQKMQMHFKDPELRRRELELLPRLFPETAVSSSLPWNIEINSIDATKGKALKNLCSALNIDLKDTLAFGDGTNDLDMIRTAGVGVAMGNAVDELKQAADWVAPTNMENGVAAGIYRFMEL